MLDQARVDNNRRVLFLDIVRGIAAISVMFEHVLMRLTESDKGYHSISLNIFNLGVFGVVSFFLVSGFVIPFSLERYKSVKIFMVSRIFRIYPVYITVFFIWLLLCFFNIYLNWNFLHGKVIVNFIYSIFFLQDYLPVKMGVVNLVPGAWTLFLEMIWYIIFASIYFFKINKKHLLLIILSNLMILFLTLISLKTSYRLPPGRPLLLLCCFLGLFVYRYFNKEVNNKTFFSIISFTLVNIYCSLYVGFGLHPSPTFSFQCVLVTYSASFLFFAMCYLLNGKKNNNFQRLISFFGNISYTLYLCHLIILVTVKPKFANEYLNCSLVIAISIIMAYCLHTIIENPFVNKGRKIIKQMRVDNK